MPEPTIMIIIIGRIGAIVAAASTAAVPNGSAPERRREAQKLPDQVLTRGFGLAEPDEEERL